MATGPRGDRQPPPPTSRRRDSRMARDFKYPVKPLSIHGVPASVAATRWAALGWGARRPPSGARPCRRLCARSGRVNGTRQGHHGLPPRYRLPPRLRRRHRGRFYSILAIAGVRAGDQTRTDRQLTVATRGGPALDAERFDTLTRLIRSRTSRRMAVGLAATGLLSMACPMRKRCAATSRRSVPSAGAAGATGAGRIGRRTGTLRLRLRL